MGEIKRCPGRTVWCFLLAAAACLASGTARAGCARNFASIPLKTGVLPCYHPWSRRSMCVR